MMRNGSLSGHPTEPVRQRLARRSWLSAATLAAGCLFFTGCDELDFGDSQRFKEDFRYDYALKPGGRLAVDNRNGGIEIIAWDRDSVEITGTKYASTEAAMKAIKIDILTAADSVRIRTVPPSGYRGGLGARYLIRVPRKTELERIESSNGSIRVEGLDGKARLRSSNGSVRVFRLNGTLEATTSNGAIEVNEQTGGSILRTSNGSVRGDRMKGSLDAATSNGGINIRLSDPEPRQRIKLETSNGGVELAMERYADNDLDLSTSNSGITLRLPSAINANLRARTTNSTVSCDFDVRTEGGVRSKSTIEGTLGSGGPRIDLSTSNGGIRLLRM